MAMLVVMPKLGLTMTEGTIEKWFKKEGDFVEKGEPLVCILTEKISYEYESPASGVLRKILHEVNEVVPVTEPIAIIASAEEDIPDLITLKLPIPEMKEEKPVEIRAERVPIEKRGILASPLAKKIAQEKGVDLTKVIGTGPGGRITKEDVLNFIEKMGKAPPLVEITPSEILPVTGIRRIIGQRMSESTRTIPHISLSIEVDMTQLLELRERILEYIEKEKGFRVSLTEILVKIVSEALRKHPLINSTFEDQQIRLYKEINIGVAMAGRDGLIVPVIRKSNESSIRKISSRVKELNQKVQSGSLSLEDVTGGTFTLTNLGMYGIDKFTAIINPPQCAILAVGKVTKKPIALDEKVVIKPISWITLSADHRIVDGAQAAEFLQEINELIENPHLALI